MDDIILKIMPALELQSKSKVGLDGGATGLLLLHYMGLKLKRNYVSLSTVESLKNDLIQHFSATTYNRSFLSGKLGFIWLMNFLEQKKICRIETNLFKSLRSLYNQFSACNEVPSIIPPCDKVYGEGLTLLSFLNDEESIFQYSVRERIIKHIDDCDRILNHPIEGIHDVLSITDRMLHSIFYFINTAHKYGIYPYKTQKLLNYFKSIDRKCNPIVSSDSIILNSLLSQKSICNIHNIYMLDTFLELLSAIGLFSIIYYEEKTLSNIFMTIFNFHKSYIRHKIERMDSLSSLSRLNGICFGLLFYELNYMKQ